MFKLSRWTKRLALVGIAICAVLFANAIPSVGEAATASSLGTAQSFAVLAGSAVTNTGPSTVNGSLGVAPGTAISGFPPGVITGGIVHSADAVALQAQIDVTTAYNALAAQACDVDLTGQDLGGMTLTPGVYCFSTSAQLTGALTLDAQGDAGAVFVFQIGTTLTTASDATVRVINGGSACNVYWKIGSSATLGTTTTFSGNILAQASITLNTGASIVGRALAQTAAVTLDTNNVTLAGCFTTTVTPTTTPVTNPTTTPTTTPATTPVTTATTTPGTTPVTAPGSTPVVAPVITATETPGGTGQTPASGNSGGTSPTGNGNGAGTAAAGSGVGTTTGTATTSATSTSSSTSATGVGARASATAQTQRVSFPNTGSVGSTTSDQAGASSASRLALMVALALLLTGGAGFVAMKRYRR